MKILLLYPEYSYPRKNPPIGLASLAGHLLTRGHEIKIVDENVSELTRDGIKALIEEWKPAVLGISFMTNQYKAAMDLISWCGENAPNTFKVAGGPHPSALPEKVIEEAPALDAVVYGEGEIALDLLISHLASGGPLDLKTLPSLAFRTKEGQIIRTPQATESFPFEDNPPWPAWDLLELTKYEVFGPSGDPDKTTFALLSSRGCPAHCTFCDAFTVFGRKFRGRGVESLMAEIKYLHDKFGMEQFDYVDDLFTVDRQRVLDFSAAMKKEYNGKMAWSANARLDRLDEEMCTAMKESGAVRIDVGVESGNPEVRQKMKKGLKNERIVRLHKHCKKIGLRTGTFLMVGNFGEDMESVKMTANLMKGLTDDPAIAIACPYPGTELYQIAKKGGFLLSEDWSKYGTAPTFLGNYEPVMYTDKMNPEQILQAYYYMCSVFATDKWRARYGQYFYLNPRFIYEYGFKTKQFGGYRRKAFLAKNLLNGTVKRWIENILPSPAAIMPAPATQPAAAVAQPEPVAH